MALKAFKQEQDDAGNLIITFDTPGERVNKFSTAIMQELSELLDELAGANYPAFLFISGKKNSFIVGADISEFRQIRTAEAGEEVSRKGQEIFRKVQALRSPFIMGIDGPCAGGGTELALWSHYRVAVDTPKTRIGLPEVNLGILPGWGGTQLMPKTIGLQRSLDFILSGRLVDARRAYRSGLVDRVMPAEFPAEHLATYLAEFAAEIKDPKKRERIVRRRLKRPLVMKLIEATGPGRNLIASQARKRIAAQTAGNYPAPLKALDSTIYSYGPKLDDGLENEARLLGELAADGVSRNLVSIFFLNESLKKDTGVDKKRPPKPRPIGSAGLLGAGVMGGGIAQLLAFRDVPVRMKDLNYDALGKGMAHARKLFDGLRRRRRLTRREVDDKMAMISPTTDYTGFKHADLVIEAVVEDMEIKRRVLQDIEPLLEKKAILVSNTSALSITELAAAAERPENVAGMHFFNPVHRMPLVEVIRGEQTSDQVVVTVVDFARKLGKTPIVVKDSPGFLVNRILGPYLNEAAFLLEEGHTMQEIDQAMRKFGMPMGPLRLLDEVGIDVAGKVAGILSEAFGDRAQPAGLLGRVLDKRWLGKKMGMGFYIHEGKATKTNSRIYGLVDDLKPGHARLDAEQIQSRMLMTMINEASMCLEEGVVRHPRDVDGGLIFGTGFPPFRGGLLRYADTLGAAKIVDELKRLEDEHGARYSPSKYLESMSKKGQKFYDD